jgi:two-component system, OmpR family, response regulator
MKVLVVEDDPALADLLERALTEEGYPVVVARSVAEAWEKAADATLLLLDRTLPDGDGLDFLRQLRAQGDRRPAVCLTARDRVEERVDGLLGGADDYVTKPFALPELLARITALSRRFEAPHLLAVGPLRVDLDANRAWRGDRELHMTAQEMKLLRVFAEQAGRVLSRARLLELAWGLKRDPGTNVVDVYVGYVRQKLDAPGEAPMLRTVRGQGWLIGPPA